MIIIIKKHIDKLKDKKTYWEQWHDIKVDDEAPVLNRLSFRMTIDNLDYLIRWHEELLANLDYYIEASKGTEQISLRF